MGSDNDIDTRRVQTSTAASRLVASNEIIWASQGAGKVCSLNAHGESIGLYILGRLLGPTRCMHEQSTLDDGVVP
jgi:hypothetical protein